MAELSVVMTSYNAREKIAMALASVAPQRDDVDLDFILVDSSTDGTDEFVREHFPWVRLLHFDERKYCGDGRNIGIAHARADVIAFMDADCVAAPDWARCILDAHAASDAPVIGGCIDNANPDAFFGWSYYFAEFSTWAPGLPAQDVDDIPGCSVTLKRSAFETYGPFLEGSYCSDSAFFWKMAHDGLRPRFDPSIRVSHLNPTRLGGIVQHAAMHGRHFGRVRRDQQRPDLRQLLVWRLAGPALPALLMMRRTLDVVRSRRRRGRFLLAAPTVFLVLSAWSLGEWRSYWAAAPSLQQSAGE